ncbi:hypothetical protein CHINAEXTREME_19315 [Halobiforma lacisalsi AJ5]|uniref:Uncharacterized protein n=1 Tax=Natronobacterium lacisalsi AJ5 TaxID=358396 RepID=M0LVD1_NATLA|nr:DUF6517 family protein [Halobiforma lacisalsi]APW99787.1 hypothetical protein CHINAEXTREME_19315 [Halobiforma lacisalsi AJ5]EMA36035.1 hypothetical protein C445_04238 [Halobiforma lacisalsi AJ5]
MQRRTLITGAGIGCLAALSGCLGAIGMDEHASSPAGVAADTRAETGYDRTGVEPLVVEEEVGPDAVSETVTVRNYLTELEKAVEVGPLVDQRAAVFTVLSTPQIGLAGRQFNPVEEMSAAELVELLESNYDDISDITFESEESVSVLGQSTTVSRFTADAEFEGTDLEVDLHITEAVRTDDDLIVTIGVYPRELRSREEAHVRMLAENVVEEIDPDDETDDGTEVEREETSDGDEEDGTEDTDGSEDDGSDAEDGDGDGDGSEDEDEDEDDGIGLTLPRP